MNVKKIAYWATTGLFSLAMLGSGFANLTQAEPVAESMAHLGFPPYLMTLLGIMKLLGVMALLAPGFDRLKEWAYAGFVFNMIGAAFSHIAVGDGPDKVIAPVMMIAVVGASYFLKSARSASDKAAVSGAVPSAA